MDTSGDPIKRFLDRLETSFDACVAKEEEGAAADLAVSLQRGMILAERLRALRRSLALLLPEGGRMPVSVVGPEHVGCGRPVRLVAPIDTAIVAAGDAHPPEVTPDTLMQALRPWADAGRCVEITSAGAVGSFQGRLVVAAPDHIVIEKAVEQVMVPIGALGAIRLARGG